MAVVTKKGLMSRDKHTRAAKTAIGNRNTRV